MIKKVWKIYLNAMQSVCKNDDNTTNKLELALVYIAISCASIFIVYYKTEKFIEDAKVLAMLLSLFSGLMYSVLLKIPDKLSKLESVKEKEGESISELKKRNEANTLNNRTFNYLKNFSFTLSYAIIVAIFCIFFVILSSFFQSLLDFHLSEITLDFDNINWIFSLKVGLIVVYRFLFLFSMLQFLYFITKSVIYLTDFTQYEFNNLR